MKDIDFDELDRAVSSVLETPADETPAAGATPAAPKDEKKPAESVTAGTAPAVEAATETPATAEAVASAPAAKTPLAVKRRGQFMDVVHPSSDMTTASSEAPATPVARKTAIQPISASVEPEKIATKEPAGLAEPVEESTEQEAPAVIVAPQSSEALDTTAPKKTWPDPLDVMETQEETQDATTAPDTSVENTAVDAAETTDTTEASEEVAPTTPFIADAQVDKRPLDAFSAEGEEVPADVPATDAAPAESLPPELQPDIVAVEANPSDHADEEPDEEPAETKEPVQPEAGLNASIPQQYTAAETKTDEDHSIFDTREYHQPLTPTPGKKKGLPGWLVAMFVILLLAGLGAAGGYFWFQYGL